MPPSIVPLSEPKIGKVFRFYVSGNCDDTYPGLPHFLWISYTNEEYRGFQLPVSLFTLGLGVSRCFRYLGDGPVLYSPRDKVWRFGVTHGMAGQTFYFQAIMLTPSQPHGAFMLKGDSELLTTELMTVRVMQSD